MKDVIKRSGIRVGFDEHKIRLAVSRAYKEKEAEYGHSIPHAEEQINEIVTKVCEELASCSENVLKIEDIQDIVETTIMDYRKDVAQAYIRYRYEHNLIRDKYNAFMDKVKDKIVANNIQNQNANVDEGSFGGRKGEAANILMKQFALDYCMSEMAKKNHLNNEIYIHDLDSYAIGCHNCLTIPFDDLLANGFNTRQVDIRPANSINTAFQLVAVIFQLQSLQQFGGVSAGHLDWTMVPYVRKSFSKHMKEALRYVEECDCEEYINSVPSELRFDDKEANDPIHAKAYKYAMDMTVKETQQAVEGMYHNLNSLQSRSGNQLPFTSINYGTCTLPEGRLVIKALLEGSIKGVGKLHKTSIFPCGIFQCMNGVNRKEGDPNYDLFKLAIQSTAKRLYPNYANCNWSGNEGYDENDPRTIFSTMGLVV